MAKSAQYGCKKCGGVLTVETNTSYNRLEIKVNDTGLIVDHSGTFEIQCKKCRKAVLTVDVDQAK